MSQKILRSVNWERRTANSWKITGWVLACLMLSGCVKQLLLVNTNPLGADVYFNGQHIGQSPVTHEFLWYDKYELRVEHDRYQPLQDNGTLNSPLWNKFPLDGVMVLLPLPLKDRHHVDFDFLNPQPAHVQAARTDNVVPPTHGGVLDDIRRIHETRQ